MWLILRHIHIYVYQTLPYYKRGFRNFLTTGVEGGYRNSRSQIATSKRTVLPSSSDTSKPLCLRTIKIYLLTEQQMTLKANSTRGSRLNISVNSELYKNHQKESLFVQLSDFFRLKAKYQEIWLLDYSFGSWNVHIHKSTWESPNCGTYNQIY